MAVRDYTPLPHVRASGAAAAGRPSESGATQPQQRPKSAAAATKDATPPGFPMPPDTDCGARCQSAKPMLGYTTPEAGAWGRPRVRDEGREREEHPAHPRGLANRKSGRPEHPSEPIRTHDPERSQQTPEDPLEEEPEEVAEAESEERDESVERQVRRSQDHEGSEEQRAASRGRDALIAGPAGVLRRHASRSASSRRSVAGPHRHTTATTSRTMRTIR